VFFQEIPLNKESFLQRHINIKGMDAKKSPRELILSTLSEKSVVKHDVWEISSSVFKNYKTVAKEIARELGLEAEKIDSRITIQYKEKGEYEFIFRFAQDVLVFTLHTNIFDFDKSHSIWKSSYVKQDPQRAFCGIIHVYNFLADSFEYNRMDDVGYLIARIFINKDRHYFVEGKRQLGFLYNNFATAEINDRDIKAIIESAILYSMDFDLLTPPYDSVKQVSVYEMFEWSKNLAIRTGKRLGFKFQADIDEIL
jgi:hypothetical protein